MAFVPLDLIFPPRCSHCGAYLGHGLALCAACRRRLVLHRTFFCGKCRGRRYSRQGLCHRGFHFTLAAATNYEDPVARALVQDLKFRFVRAAAGHLGNILATHAERLKVCRSYDLVVPVPLSRRRLRERGFNQAELIASKFCQRTGLPFDARALKRIRHAPPQSGLKGGGARRANVAGSFRASSALRGRRVILVDDVTTSGATLLEASLALKASGASDILALTVAKA